MLILYIDSELYHDDQADKLCQVPKPFMGGM